jgi:delta(3,5)-delta(2,4)-dienoyl-CoA isomerase
MTLSTLPDVKYFNVDFPSQYVAHVEINRPEKLNAFFEEMWYELEAIFKFLSRNVDVRVILLSGAGDRAFTAGTNTRNVSLISADIKIRSRRI